MLQAVKCKYRRFVFLLSWFLFFLELFVVVVVARAELFTFSSTEKVNMLSLCIWTTYSGSQELLLPCSGSKIEASTSARTSQHISAVLSCCCCCAAHHCAAAEALCCWVCVQRVKMHCSEKHFFGCSGMCGWVKSSQEEGNASKPFQSSVYTLTWVHSRSRMQLHLSALYQSLFCGPIKSKNQQC